MMSLIRDLLDPRSTTVETIHPADPNNIVARMTDRVANRPNTALAAKREHELAKLREQIRHWANEGHQQGPRCMDADPTRKG